MPNKEKCLQCSLDCVTDDEEERSIYCEKCTRYIHYSCTKLDLGTLNVLANSSANFFCHKCDKNFHSKIKSRSTKNKTAVPTDKSDNSFAVELRKISTQLVKLEQIDTSVKFMSDKFDDMRNEILELKKELKSSTKINKELQQEVSSLRTSVKSLQDELVSKKCFIQKINVPASQSPLTTVREMVSSIGVPVESVVAASLRTSKNKEQFVIAEFVNTEERLKFLKLKKKLQEQPNFSRVIAYDAMGAETMKIYKYAAALKSIGFKFVYHRSGVIYAKKDEEDRRPAFIRSYEDVDRLLSRGASYSGAT